MSAVLPLVALGVGGLAIWALSKGKPAPNEPIVVSAHTYQLAVRWSQTSRDTSNFPRLAARLAQLGWAGVVPQPQTDVDPFVYHVIAIWMGPSGSLVDSDDVKYLSGADLGGPGGAPAQGGGAQGGGAQAPQQGAPQQGAAQLPQGKYDEPGGQRLPPQTEMTVDKMLLSETDPNALEEMASGLGPWPRAATMLRAKAAGIRAFANMAGGGGGGQVPQNPYLPQAPQLTLPQFTPPTPLIPSAPPAGGDAIFNAGALPLLGPIPGAGRVSTPAHRKGQLGLLAWSQRFQPGAFGTRDVDGVIGPKTQKVTQIFQAWGNANRGLHLTLDGLFGTQTYSALLEFSNPTEL